MSFCRLSDDCDAYVYMTDDGLVDIIIRGSIENPAYSVPEGLDELAEMEFMIKHYDDLYMPWDNHHAGEKFYELVLFRRSKSWKRCESTVSDSPTM